MKIRERGMRFAAALFFLCGLFAAWRSLVAFGSGAWRELSPSSFLPTSLWRGFLGSLNYLIGWYNLKYEDGRLLFLSGEIAESEILAFSAALFVGIAVVAFFALRGRRLFLPLLLAAVFLGAGVFVGRVSALSWILLAAASLGLWLNRLGNLRLLRHLFWILFPCAVLLGVYFLLGGGELSGVREFRAQAMSGLRRLRFGEDSLPQGDLSAAKDMFAGEEPRLSVRSAQAKNLYLRGYTAGRYEDGKWLPLKKAAYGGENSGLLTWLADEGLSAQNQYAAYLQAGKDSSMAENRLEVKNIGASREYLYVPYSASEESSLRAAAYRDAGYRSRGLFGTRRYSFQEESGTLPAELLYAADWVKAPQDEAQEQYLEAEAVYRSFVYENYLEVDEELAPLLTEMFWSGDGADCDGIYSCTDRIRTVLEGRTVYQKIPDAVPDGTDPIRWFLSGGSGNDAFYAAAAVLAYRAAGIPARYAEGYYVTEAALLAAEDGTVELTDQDGHAWAEVYLDGVGWLPVDVTPGCYYDVRALMELLGRPQEVQRTAALVEDGEDTANHMPEPEAGTGRAAAGSFSAAFGILVGILVFLILAAAVAFLVFYLWYAAAARRRLLAYRRLGAAERAAVLEEHIWRGLALAGLPAQAGWNAGETEAKLRVKFPAFLAGEYLRVNELAEKRLYGGGEPEAHELRVLEGFLQKLRGEFRKSGLRGRFAADWTLR